MSGVIVEYKNQNRIRIVENAIERRTREYRNAKIIAEVKLQTEHTEMVGSVDRGPTVDRWWYKHPDLKCWKSKKHAKKGWMRHLHRIGYPSVRALVDKCIYPAVNSFERR